MKNADKGSDWYNLSRDFLTLYILIIAVFLASMTGLIALLPERLARGDTSFIFLVAGSAVLFTTGTLFLHREYRSLDRKIGRTFMFDYDRGIEALERLLKSMGLNYSRERVQSSWIHQGWFDRYTIEGPGLGTVLEIITTRYGHRRLRMLVRGDSPSPEMHRLCRELSRELDSRELRGENTEYNGIRSAQEEKAANDNGEGAV